MRVYFILLLGLGFSLFANDNKKDLLYLTYSFKTDSILNKKIEFKYPVNIAWEHQCGQYFYYYFRDQILPKTKTLTNQINFVEILYRPEENISAELLLKEKKLVLKFHLNRNEIMQGYCSYEEVNSELLTALKVIAGPVEPNPGQNPVPNPGQNPVPNPGQNPVPNPGQNPVPNPGQNPVPNPGTISSLPPYNSTWNFSKAINYILGHDFGQEEFRIIRRFEWGAKKPQDSMDDMPSALVDGVVIHNTEFRKDETVKKVQDLHMNKNKWSDIGYHFVIAKNQGKWMVYEGRSLSKVGAHVGEGKNQWKIGISLQGDYNQKTSSSHSHGFPANASEHEKQPEPGAVFALGQLLAHLEKEYGKLPIVYAHGLGPHAANPGHTDCPGVGMLHIVESFKKKYR